ncbi:MAG TPA: trigger factor [Bacteroidales bacterium]|nr:trigger factor [Bacteroidales bacterium]HRZ50263.1 trigger factor [Bacteroidales bacterium]
MNITQESTGALTATVTIDIGKADYQPLLEEKLRDYRKKMKMPGFREGKVPLGVVNKMYGKAVLAEVINTLISDNLQKHLDENHAETLASPLPNREKQEPIDFDTQESFSFSFDIALRPEIHTHFSTLEGLVKYEVIPDEKSVEDYLQHILKQYGTLEETDVVAEGDMLHCEIDEVNDAGERFMGSIHSHGHVTVDLIKDAEIRNQFIGSATGKVIRMNPMTAFDNRTEVAALLGIKTEELQEPLNMFDFEITKIERKIPAAIDEKLLAEVFPDDQLTSEEDLRNRIRRDIAESYNKEAENRMLADALEKLLEQSAIELPDAFMKRWLLENEEGEKSTPEEIDAHYDDYARQLRYALIRNHIITENDLRVTAGDLELYVASVLRLPEPDQQREDQKEMVKRLTGTLIQDKKQFDEISDRIMEDKIARLILEKVPYTTQEITLEEFNKTV